MWRATLDEWRANSTDRPTRRLALVPHMGMGDALVMHGAVADLCSLVDDFTLVCDAKFATSIASLESETRTRARRPIKILSLPNGASDISVRFGAQDDHVLRHLHETHDLVVTSGDHSGEKWHVTDDWVDDLYAQLGTGSRWRRWTAGTHPMPKDYESALALKARVEVRVSRHQPYVLVHDDPLRPLVLPPLDPEVIVVHVDDPRIASRSILEYVELVRGAHEIHAIDSCFAILADMLGVARLTVHAYAKGPHAKFTPKTFVHTTPRIIDAPPAKSHRNVHAIPFDFLRVNARHFMALQDIAGRTFDAWTPCGSFLMSGASLDYDPTTQPKQHMLVRAIQGKKAALEIGVHAGHSALLMLLAEPGVHVTLVDIGVFEHTAICVAYLQAAFPGRVTYLEGDSVKVLSYVKGRTFDFVHVDGDHAYESVLADIRAAQRLGVPKCTLLVDDWYSEGVARVVSAQHDTFANARVSGGAHPAALLEPFVLV